MLPGTFAYVTTGHAGKSVLLEGGGGDALSVAPWQVGLGITATVVALGFIGQLAKKAVEEADAEVREQEEARTLQQQQEQQQGQEHRQTQGLGQGQQQIGDGHAGKVLARGGGNGKRAHGDEEEGGGRQV
jgi:hypothetical protein